MIGKILSSITDQNVSLIILYVFPCVKTRFIGTVINQDSKPVSGADIRVYPIKERRFPAQDIDRNYTTDDNGHFDIAILSKPLPNSPSIKGIVNAVSGKKIPGYWKPIIRNGQEYGASPIEEKFIPYAEGETPVEFTVGDTIDNIKIITKSFELKELDAQIMAEDGAIPDDLSVSIRQNDLDYNVENITNGHFVAQGLRDGYFSIHVDYSTKKDENSDFGQRIFCDKTVSLLFPPEQKKMFAEIKLEEAGYLAGYVLRQGMTPVENIQVSTRLPSGQETSRISDNQGFFRLWVPKNGKYSIFAAEGEAKNPSKYFDAIAPSRKDIIIKLP